VSSGVAIPPVVIANRRIGEGFPALIVAEIGNTHEGSIGQAQALIAAAADSGADAVKLQTHIAEAEMVPQAPFPPYFRPKESRGDYFRRTAFCKEQYLELGEFARQRGVLLLSSPFSIDAVDLLEEVGIAAYKIPSGEVTNLPLLAYIGGLRRPVLLSSGMSSWAELDEAHATLSRHHDQIVILQCTSSYPCPPQSVGINLLREMRERYGGPVGLSDHTTTIFASIAAVTLGASVIEKHFTLSKRMFGPDPPFSHEPAEFAELVRGIREVEAALAHPIDKDNVDQFRDMKAIFEKSIVAARDLPVGTILSEQDLTTKKPGTGLAPRRLPDLLGRRTAVFLPKDSLITESEIA
jgi:N,N'-diacetyllegionaminate synthase